jgi:AcrR family transcriptional regulator
MGDSGTRDAILDAARDLFADRGYDGTSLRAIAGAAGVDPALIRHFYSDKEGLFAAVISSRSTVPDRIAAAFPGPPDELGARFTDAYLRLWEDPATQPILLALLRSATTSPHAAEVLAETLGSHIGQQSAHGLPDPSRMHRFALAAAHLFGVAFGRYVLRLPPLADISRADLVTELAPTIQHYLGDSAASGPRDRAAARPAS